MSSLRSVIRYICSNYPHSHELSNARLTKMVYLSDWEYARRYNTQITDIQWFFNNYGPYVEDVLNEAKNDPLINVLHTATLYGTPKVQMEYIGSEKDYSLTNEEKEVIDYVINETKIKYWNSFIKYVYDTFPIRNNPHYSQLNLIELADTERRYSNQSVQVER